MPLKMMYITNNPKVAQIAENNSVDRIWVDLETIGKAKRQGGMNTVQSNHTMEDISLIKNSISKAELLVRINPIYERSQEEIAEVIKRGADIVMLPYFESMEEVDRFMEYMQGSKTRTMLLLETIWAERNIGEILEKYPVDEVHIGLNDLHLQYHQKFMFELLANGKVEKICNQLRKLNVPYGFGGIARLDEGMLPARHIIAEHYRLGSSMTILSRSFYDSWVSNDLEEIERVFRYGMREIREYEQRLMHESDAFFEENRRTVKREVDDVLKKIG